MAPPGTLLWHRHAPRLPLQTASRELCPSQPGRGGSSVPLQPAGGQRLLLRAAGAGAAEREEPARGRRGL